MKVLVCGGRDFYDVNLLFNTLNKIHKERKISSIIEGDASGADRLAGSWAISKDVKLEKFPANWKSYGRSAGMIRNKQMLEFGKPNLVIACPGGKGTANMIKLAKEANVEVMEIK